MYGMLKLSMTMMEEEEEQEERDADDEDDHSAREGWETLTCKDRRDAVQAYLQWVAQEHARTGEQGARGTGERPVHEQKANAVGKMLGIASNLLFRLRLDCINRLSRYYFPLIRRHRILYVKESLSIRPLIAANGRSDIDTVLGFASPELLALLQHGSSSPDDVVHAGEARSLLHARVKGLFVYGLFNMLWSGDQHRVSLTVSRLAPLDT
jgi:hypothetical protein